LLGPYVAATPPPSADALAAVKPSDCASTCATAAACRARREVSRRRSEARRLRDQQRRNADSFDYDTTQIRATSNARRSPASACAATSISRGDRDADPRSDRSARRRHGDRPEKTTSRWPT
jgi:hypothetical protein